MRGSRTLTPWEAILEKSGNEVLKLLITYFYQLRIYTFQCKVSTSVQLERAWYSIAVFIADIAAVDLSMNSVNRLLLLMPNPLIVGQCNPFQTSLFVQPAVYFRLLRARCEIKRLISVISQVDRLLLLAVYIGRSIKHAINDLGTYLDLHTIHLFDFLNNFEDL
jgi:hypothetical protein